jgi:hypothetical protein
MTVGDSIFLSALLLSMVGLYAATKDRWNWKRVARWSLGLPAVVLALTAAGFWGYSKYNDRPMKQEEFAGVKLTFTPDDVKFAKGEPLLFDGKPDRWIYYSKDSGGNITSGYVVRFENQKVKYVMYASSPTNIYHPELLGFKIGASIDDVVAKLGPPGNVASSSDGLERVLSFPTYQVFFSFTQAKVKDYGVYNPDFGPMSAPQRAPGDSASSPR